MTLCTLWGVQRTSSSVPRKVRCTKATEVAVVLTAELPGTVPKSIRVPGLTLAYGRIPEQELVDPSCGGAFFGRVALDLPHLRR
jgi:hypothetical protein